MADPELALRLMATRASARSDLENSATGIENLLDLFEKSARFLATTDGPNHRLGFANARFRGLFDRRTIIGKPAAEAFSASGAFPAADCERLLAACDLALASGDPVAEAGISVDLAEKDRAQRLRHLNVLVQPMRDTDGLVIGLLIEGQDVTDSKLAEDHALAVQAELIHLSRLSAIGALASTLAHEISQPLTAISNYAAGMHRTLGRLPDRDPYLMQGVEAIMASAARAGDIVDHLRSITRKSETRKKSIDLAMLIRQTLAVHLAAETTDIEISFDLAVIEGIIFRVDALKIQQVLITLIRNACEAVIDCDNRKVTITAAQAGQAIQISIGDSGGGIDPALQNHLFDAFHASKKEGMGVGLSLSRTIVEAHGGSIWALSNAGPNIGGATLCFTLPL